MNKTIEEVEKERDEILARALKLAELVRAYGPFRRDANDAASEIEALRPKPKPRECWVARFDKIRQYDYGFGYAWKTEERAKKGDQSAAEFIHMREVLPAPKWERWTEDDLRTIRDLHLSGTEYLRVIAETHNATMDKMQALWEGGADE